MAYNNGIEMAQNRLFTKHTKVKVYFTHPYNSCDRPTNETKNGFLRQDFQKGTDLSLVSKERFQYVQDE